MVSMEKVSVILADQALIMVHSEFFLYNSVRDCSLKNVHINVYVEKQMAKGSLDDFKEWGYVPRKLYLFI